MRKTALALATALQTLAIGLAHAAASSDTPLPAMGEGGTAPGVREPEAHASDLRVAQATNSNPQGSDTSRGQRLEFNIPEQPLEDALNKFAEQTGYQVMFQSGMVGKQTAPRVDGALTPDQALKTLLSNSTLRYKFVNPRTVTISAAEEAANRTGEKPLRLAQNSGTPDTGKTGDTGEARNTGPEGSKEEKQTDPDKGQSESLEEIIVTAQKREERLIDVPISIAAIGGDELQRRNVTRLDELSMSVPGLSIQSSGSFQRRIALRGISNVFGDSPLIGVYLDEATVTSAPTTQLDLRTYDLERVEVLRGPQGTLYGEGSVGGTIRFITRNPGLDRFAMNADVAALFTEDGEPGQRVEAAVNVPVITDELGFRIAGTFDHQGGWMDQPAAGRKDYNDQKLADVRVKGLWKATERFTVNLMAAVHRNDAAPNTGEDDHGNFNQVFNLTATPTSDDDYSIYNATASYDFGAARLLSTTTYIDQDQRVRNNGARFQFQPPGQARHEFFFSQFSTSEIANEELRLTSNGSGPWRWTIGGFYRYARFGSELDGIFALPIAPGDALPAGFSSVERTVSKSWAAFGDASYALTSRLTLGAGVRYFEDDQEFTSGTTQSGTFDAVSPRVYAQLKLADDANVYASVAKGFRSGGFNGQGQPPFDPETVLTYELGTKMYLLDGRLSSDVAVFYTDYSDYQIAQLPPPPALALVFNSNAGDARIKGIEWAMNWRPTRQWSLSLSGTYLDTEFHAISAAASSYEVGDPLDLFPKYGVSVAAQRDFSWNGKSGYIRLDYDKRGRSTFRNRLFGSWYYGESDVIDLANFSVGLDWNERLSLGFFAQNLLNDRGYTDALGIEENAARSRPRTYGVQLGVRFD